MERIKFSTKGRTKTISELDRDENGIYILHKGKTDSASDLIGHDKMLDMLECQDVKNFLHLFRIWHGLRFLTKYVKDHATVVDLGAGYCEMPFGCQTMCRKYNYYCLEYDYKKLKAAASRKIGKFNRILVHADLSRGELPFKDSEVDAVVCFEFAEHIRKEAFANLLIEINRVMLPNAYAIFSTPNAEAGGITHAIGHVYEYAYSEFRSLIESAGFVILKAYGLGGPAKEERIVDETISNNELYRNLLELLPPSFIRQVALVNKPEKNKSFSLICQKISIPDREKMLNLDFSISDSHNMNRFNINLKKAAIKYGMPREDIENYFISLE